jgi:hypothetical protein
MAGLSPASYYDSLATTYTSQSVDERLIQMLPAAAAHVTAAPALPPLSVPSDECGNTLRAFAPLFCTTTIPPI